MAAPSGMQGQEEIDVCVATIMTVDRVSSLHRLARSWSGELSVAFLSSDFATDRERGIALLELDGKPPPQPERITLALVRDEGYRAPRNRFPFNLLRNRAVGACLAAAVLTVDVDFVLGGGGASLGADGTGRALRRLAASLDAHSNTAYVLPAFEVGGEAAADGGIASQQRLALIQQRTVCARVRSLRRVAAPRSNVTPPCCRPAACCSTAPPRRHYCCNPISV